METKTRISDEEIRTETEGATDYDAIESAIERLTGGFARRDIQGLEEWDVAIEDDDGAIWVWSHYECSGEWVRAENPIFRCTIDNGQGGEAWIRATSTESALELAMEWAKEGDWSGEMPTDPCEQYVIVRVLDVDGDVAAEGSFCPWED